MINPTDKWPRRLIDESNHYMVHKVSSVIIRDDILRFIFIQEDGHEYKGPSYLSSWNDRIPEASIMLKENGLVGADEIRFVIVYHCGAYPNGNPMRLLREYPCEESQEYAMKIKGDIAKKS